jgi:hypothetical protein
LSSLAPVGVMWERRRLLLECMEESPEVDVSKAVRAWPQMAPAMIPNVQTGKANAVVR